MTKRAVEICQKKRATKVVYQDVLDSFHELYNSKAVPVLQCLQKQEVLVVLAIFCEL